MQITHVLRGQEWLASAPLHQLIADGLGIGLPVLVHLPVILDPSGKGKMSKRKKVVDGKEYLALVYEFIAAGYLPDAMFNFLTNVGWNFDAEREIFSREEAVARFNLEQINPSPAALPYDKLEWMNGLYIREMDPQALKPLVIPYLAASYGMAEADLAQDERLDILVPLIQERIKRLDEAPEWLDWAFKPADAIVYDDLSLLIGRKLDAAQSADLLERSAGLLAELAPFHSEPIQESLRAAAGEWGVSAGALFGPLRGAVSGKKVSPPLFESMEALGRAEVLARIERAVAALRG
jgi:glutamyl-tRNA synthetase